MWRLYTSNKILGQIENEKNWDKHQQIIKDIMKKPRNKLQNSNFKHLSKYQNKYEKWRQKYVMNENKKLLNSINNINEFKGALNSQVVQMSIFKAFQINKLPQKINRNKNIENENKVFQKENFQMN